MNILESILKTLRDAAAYNQHELAAPRVILWPDEDRLWVSCIEVLRVDYPALWTLGDYQPDKAIGPAAWLRYQLETHSDLAANADVPIIYLPGVGRAAFRSAEQCPKPAKHLYALQFQGQFWTQKNGKDWTPYAFLSSSDGGLKLDVAADQDTRRAIQESLRALMEVDIEGLRGRKLEASDLRVLVIHDPARTVLRWIGNPVKIKAELQRAETEWTSFCAVCRSIYHFDPERDGALIAAENLTTGKGDWVHVWTCYQDAPEAYPGVREILDKLPAKPSGFFDTGDEYHPQSNSDQESRLESALLSLVNASPKDAIETVVRLAQDHAHRVTWPWAKLGYAPLARAIIPLQELAQLAQSSGTPTTWEALAEYYANVGWKVDRSVIQAIDAAHPALAAKAVATAIRAIYIPWLERYATVAQGLAPAYPTSAPDKCRSLPVEQGTIYLFVDGLRMDLARRLEDKLHASSLNATLNHDWSALPTVTATAKPAWQALASKLRGPLEGDAFQPREKGNGKALTHPRFKQLLEELGITFVESIELALPSGCGWSEFSNFDSYGHEQGAKLAWRVEEELAGLRPLPTLSRAELLRRREGVA